MKYRLSFSDDDDDGVDDNGNNDGNDNVMITKLFSLKNYAKLSFTAYINSFSIKSYCNFILFVLIIKKSRATKNNHFVHNYLGETSFFLLLFYSFIMRSLKK